MKKIGKAKKLDTWLPHVLCEKNKEDHNSIVINFISRQKNDPFLKNIITGDENWVIYDNIQCKRQWVNKNESALPNSKDKASRKKVI